MKITCDVIRDLIPAYVDGTLSNDSKMLVDEHVAVCTECRSYMEDMRIPESEKAEDRKETAHFLRGVKGRLLRRNVRTVIITIICFAVCISAFYAYDIYHPSYMTSNKVDLEVKHAGGKAELYSKKPYDCANYYEKGKTLFVYCTNTVTNRLISSISGREGSPMQGDLNDEYDAVYYMPKSVAEKLIKSDNDPEHYGGYFNSISAGQLKAESDCIWKK